MAWVTQQQLANMCGLAGPSDWNVVPWGNSKGMKGMGWDQAKGKGQGKGVVRAAYTKRGDQYIESRMYACARSRRIYESQTDFLFLAEKQVAQE